MKKQNIINLVKYHVEKNNDAFSLEVAQIAKELDSAGDHQMAQYLMELISNTNMYVPQSSYNSFHFLEKKEYSSNPLHLPNIIEEDVIGIVRAIKKNSGLTRFLFYGAPGTGKTESAYQIARLLDRDILTVNLEELIDSKLGETSKNVRKLFNEISHLVYDRSIVIIDELDALVMNRMSDNDLREMGRVTSTFLRELDSLNSQVVIIATTNLIAGFDKALLRRFDSNISFDRYSKEDLIEIADSLLITYIKSSNSRQDIRLFNKILNTRDSIPLPGDMKQIIRTSIAFSDDNGSYDYLRKIYLALNDNSEINIQKLLDEGFTTREIEIITRIPRSSISRKYKGSRL